jgi:uncharacterized protein (TIGR00730 family)
MPNDDFEDKSADTKRIRKARRRRLTERLDVLRERAILIELELNDYTNDFFRVCIFGSARIKPDDDIYRATERIAYLLAKEGIDILTGGGPGLMEAANKGARAGQVASGSKSKSFGISVDLGDRENSNEHLDIKHHHRRFSSRLDDFIRLSHAVVVTPGGIGTLLELFFSWQLLQVGHLKERPIILLGRAFWSGLLEWMRHEQVARGLVGSNDMRWTQVVDTPEEVAAVVSSVHQRFLEQVSAKNVHQDKSE